MSYDIIIGFLWGQKINIVGSIFLGLFIYSYFYRKLNKREKQLSDIIIRTILIKKRIEKMSEKTDVQAILDAVAGFNNSISGFRNELVNLFKQGIDDLETRIMKHFDKEMSRTNEAIQDAKDDIEKIKINAANEKTEVRLQKNKLAMVVSISVFFSTLILGIIQYFILKLIG